MNLLARKRRKLPSERLVTEVDFLNLCKRAKTLRMNLLVREMTKLPRKRLVPEVGSLTPGEEGLDVEDEPLSEGDDEAAQ